MNDNENRLVATDSDQMQVMFRPATENDAEAIIELLTTNLDAFPALSSYYIRPSVDSWNNSLERDGFSFLDSHVLADVMVAGKRFSPAGYARIYRFPAAGGQDCGYIRGPWVDPSLGEELVTIIEREIATRTLEKMKELGLPLARAQVPLLLPSRLSLFKDVLGFVVLDRIFSYGRQLGEELPHAPVSFQGVTFSLYGGTAGEDQEVIELHNAVFPREKFTADSFADLKKRYRGFKDGHYIHLARVDGMLAGMAWSILRQYPGGSTICLIEDLAVHPSYQRQGIARALVFRCLQQSKEKGILEATTNISTLNQPSIKTFERCGFTYQPLTGEELLEKKIGE